MTDLVTLYRDKAGEWRWNRRDPSTGNIVADSGEGYENFGDCEDQARQVNGEQVDYVSEDGAVLPGEGGGKDNDVDDSWQDNEPENQPDP